MPKRGKRTRAGQHRQHMRAIEYQLAKDTRADDMRGVTPDSLGALGQSRMTGIHQAGVTMHFGRDLLDDTKIGARDSLMRDSRDGVMVRGRSLGQFAPMGDGIARWRNGPSDAEMLGSTKYDAEVIVSVDYWDASTDERKTAHVPESMVGIVHPTHVAPPPLTAEQQYQRRAW